MYEVKVFHNEDLIIHSYYQKYLLPFECLELSDQEIVDMLIGHVTKNIISENMLEIGIYNININKVGKKSKKEINLQQFERYYINMSDKQ